MRYFFDVRSSKGLIADPEGQMFLNIAAIEEDVLESAREIIANEIKANRVVDRSRVFEVRDDAGTLVLTVPFTKALKETA